MNIFDYDKVPEPPDQRIERHCPSCGECGRPSAGMFWIVLQGTIVYE